MLNLIISTQIYLYRTLQLELLPNKSVILNLKSANTTLVFDFGESKYGDNVILEKTSISPLKSWKLVVTDSSNVLW